MALEARADQGQNRLEPRVVVGDLEGQVDLVEDLKLVGKRKWQVMEVLVMEYLQSFQKGMRTKVYIRLVLTQRTALTIHTATGVLEH